MGWDYELQLLGNLPGCVGIPLPCLLNNLLTLVKSQGANVSSGSIPSQFGPVEVRPSVQLTQDLPLIASSHQRQENVLGDYGRHRIDSSSMSSPPFCCSTSLLISLKVSKDARLNGCKSAKVFTSLMVISAPTTSATLRS